MCLLLRSSFYIINKKVIIHVLFIDVPIMNKFFKLTININSFTNNSFNFRVKMRHCDVKNS